MEGAQTMRKWRSSFAVEFWFILLIMAGYGFIAYMIAVTGSKGYLGHRPPHPGAVVLSYFFGALDLFMGWILLKMFPVVVVTPDGIDVRYLWGRNSNAWSEITDIKIMDRVDFRLLGARQRSAATLLLKDGGRLSIRADAYGNMYQLRQLLFVANRIRQEGASLDMLFSRWKTYGFKTALVDAGDGSLPGEDLERFSGNPWVSGNNILLMVVLLMGLLLIGVGASKAIQHNLLPALLGGLTLSLLLYGGLGTQMYYFLINDRFLLVKNHYFPFRRKVFEWKEIDSVFIDRPGKRSREMVVVAKDFRTFKFSAGSFRRKDWNALEEKGKGMGLSWKEYDL
jgi:hypothetical protein